MSGIAGIEAVGVPQSAQTHDQRSNRAPVDFGGAVTHRDMVREKLRVDPAALADKKRAAESVRRREQPPRESVRDQRFAQDEAEARQAKGQYVDIEA